MLYWLLLSVGLAIYGQVQVLDDGTPIPPSRTSRMAAAVYDDGTPIPPAPQR